MAQQRDYYSILEVHRDASQEEIEVAYRRLAEVYAPGSRRRKARAAARRREIEAAFSVLGDETKRARYDRRLAGGIHPSQPREQLWLSSAVPMFLSRPLSLVALPAAGLGIFLVGTLLLSALGRNGGETAAGDQPSAGPAGSGDTASTPSPEVPYELPEGFTQFTSDAKGYSIAYPDGWGTEEGDFGSDVFWEFGARPELSNNVSILCEEIDAGFADEYVDQNIELLRSQVQDVEIVDDNLRIAGSSAGTLVHWSTSIGDSAIEVAQAVVAIDGCGWVLTLTARAGLRDKYEPTFAEMIRSFRVSRLRATSSRLSMTPPSELSTNDALHQFSSAASVLASALVASPSARPRRGASDNLIPSQLRPLCTLSLVPVLRRCGSY